MSTTNSSSDDQSNKYFQLSRVRNMESFVGRGGKTGDSSLEREKERHEIRLLSNVEGQKSNVGHKGAAGM